MIGDVGPLLVEPGLRGKSPINPVVSLESYLIVTFISSLKIKAPQPKAKYNITQSGPTTDPIGISQNVHHASYRGARAC